MGPPDVTPFVITVRAYRTRTKCQIYAVSSHIHARLERNSITDK